MKFTTREEAIEKLEYWDHGTDAAEFIDAIIEMEREAIRARIGEALKVVSGRVDRDLRPPMGPSTLAGLGVDPATAPPAYAPRNIETVPPKGSVGSMGSVYPNAKPGEVFVIRSIAPGEIVTCIPDSRIS
jgi:hypothetical protein